jgi:LPS-assembly lipoprotein
MRFVALILVAFALVGCGFTPLHSAHTNSDTSLNRVWIDTLPNSDGLMLRNALIDRFYTNGMPDQTPYILQIELTQLQRDLVIDKDSTTTRAQLVYRADYHLIDRTTRQSVDSGSMRAIGSYNILSSQYTTLVTENAAREQALQELADKLTLRMGVVLHTR